MPKPLSNDLRERIVRAVEEGASVRFVGARFGVSASSVNNIFRLWRETGNVAPKKMGGENGPSACHLGTIFPFRCASSRKAIPSLKSGGGAATLPCRAYIRVVKLL